MPNLKIKHLECQVLYKGSTKHEIRPNRRVLAHTEVFPDHKNKCCTYSYHIPIFYSYEELKSNAVITCTQQ